ncbi:hypothetical protein FDECE_16037 [Fusarium decemcellulare]|nr:hypothetical protein FDECE_16037 [Fusarium decemcellulare]
MALARLPIPLRLLLFTALCASTTSAMPASHLFSRQDTCDADQISCNSSLADNFCCPKSSSCMLLAGETTAMCCPKGNTCDTIKPITCDIRGQDIKQFPNAPVMTVVFNVDLEKCGNNCCPFGYSCKDGERCVLDSDQSEVPEGAELPSASSSAAPSATSTEASSDKTVSTTGVPSSAGDSDEEEPKPDNSGPATTSVIGGVVGGCIILLIIAIVVFLYFRRKNKGKGPGSEKGSHLYGSRRASSEASFGNIISEPIIQPNSYRADFILKTPSQDSRRSSIPTRQLSNASRIQAPPPRIRISIPNPFDSPNPSPNNNSAQPSPADDESLRHGNVRLPPIRAMKASSHCSRRPGTGELEREPSSECINVFADPNTVVKPRRLTHATTFTDLMDEADLSDVRRGRPYVPGTTPRI